MIFCEIFAKKQLMRLQMLKDPERRFSLTTPEYLVVIWESTLVDRFDRVFVKGEEGRLVYLVKLVALQNTAGS